jgi:hypothetical protein
MAAGRRIRSASASSMNGLRILEEANLENPSMRNYR